MWIQQPDIERRIPPLPIGDIPMVNPRGRVVLALARDCDRLIGEGFKLAPPDSKEGSYIPVYDRGDNNRPNDNVLAPDQKTNDLPDILPTIEIR